jgi:hypothetical protein
MLPETPNPRYRGFGKARSVVSIEPAIALVDDDFMTPRVPAGSVVVPAVDVVNDHLSISPAIPMFPVPVAEPLDPHHSWGMTLHDDSVHWTPVAGISSVYCDTAGDRAAANHDFCRYLLSVKRSCH